MPFVPFLCVCTIQIYLPLLALQHLHVDVFSVMLLVYSWLSRGIHHYWEQGEGMLMSRYLEISRYLLLFPGFVSL